MGVLQTVLKFVGLVPGRSQEDVWQEGTDNEASRERVSSRLAEDAREYLTRHGDGLTVQQLGRMLGRDEGRDEGGDGGA